MWADAVAKVRKIFEPNNYSWEKCFFCMVQMGHDERTLQIRVAFPLLALFHCLLFDASTASKTV
jgi:hypothetical protein